VASTLEHILGIATKQRCGVHAVHAAYGGCPVHTISYLTVISVNNFLRTVPLIKLLLASRTDDGSLTLQFVNRNEAVTACKKMQKRK